MHACMHADTRIQTNFLESTGSLLSRWSGVGGPLRTTKELGAHIGNDGKSCWLGSLVGPRWTINRRGSVGGPLGCPLRVFLGLLSIRR